MNLARLIAALAAIAAFGQPVRDVTLLEGRGELLTFAREITRVVIAEPKIADAIVVSPQEVMVNAKSPGKTTLIVWETGSAPARFNVDVKADPEILSKFDSDLAADLKRDLPQEKIAFTGNSETIVLSGSASSLDAAERAAAIASTRSKKVVNRIAVPAAEDPKQILLHVKFAAVDRANLSELGFNFISRNPTMLGSTSTQQYQQPRISQLQFQNQEFANTTINFADLLNIFVFRPDLNIGATVRALQQRNLLQILAEPNLITVEGKEASFVAGGEFPFPVLQATATGGAVAPVVTVQFRPFGVQLGFTPTLTATGAIRLKVRPEVSALDYTNSVNVQGTLIPALSTRRAETEVVLKDGESFAIAGLIDNRVIQVMNKVLGLGDIPILGQLFRSRSTRKTNDELLVVITPRFVRPLTPEERASLPETVETFLPTVSEQKQKDAQKKTFRPFGKSKDEKAPPKPQFQGPRGHQEPAAPKP
ncbi:MAG: pilus assembly protein N-terminal domain-containing protein [Bryobacteraceae bacterium]|nr:pilus assembly protein N-terminal domain-containing protein [Bryobacteraceae bacterium]